MSAMSTRIFIAQLHSLEYGRESQTVKAQALLTQKRAGEVRRRASLASSLSWYKRKDRAERRQDWCGPRSMVPSDTAVASLRTQPVVGDKLIVQAPFPAECPQGWTRIDDRTFWRVAGSADPTTIVLEPMCKAQASS